MAIFHPKEGTGELIKIPRTDRGSRRMIAGREKWPNLIFEIQTLKFKTRPNLAPRQGKKVVKGQFQPPRGRYPPDIIIFKPSSGNLTQPALRIHNPH